MKGCQSERNITRMSHRDWQYKLVATKLHSGYVIAYPTEGVWGLGCLPENETAAMKILALKKRSWEKGLILIGSSLKQIEPYIMLGTAETGVLENSADRGVTYLVEKSERVPLWISGIHHKVAVRLTNHATVKGICESVGQPIVSTSANIAGRPAAKTRMQLLGSFGQQIDYIVPGQLGGRQGASEIVDLATGAVIRQGGT